MHTVRRLGVLIVMGLLGLMPGLVGAGTAQAAGVTWYVAASGSNPASCPVGGNSPSTAFQTIGFALGCAHHGDGIVIGPGTFAEDLTITVSVTITGAGAKKTIIHGVGDAPVVTIGTFQAPPETEPTVSITGVTITGGFNSSYVFSNRPAGGGINIVASSTPTQPFATGATVTITDSVITGNTVKAVQSSPCPPPPPGCTFSVAASGGIDNAGVLTLNNTTVSNNTAGSDVTSDSMFSVGIGGGIQTYGEGTLTLHASTVSGNQITMATAHALGRFAFGGGINSDGPFAMDGSTITGNSISVMSTDPNTDMFGVGGGLHVTGVATVQRSRITDNSVTVTGVGGAVNTGANASAGGIDDDGSILLQDSTVSNNRVRASITSTTTNSNSLSDAGGMEIDGAATIQNTTFTGNSATSTSVAATANGGASPNGGALGMFTGQPVTITNSVISGNSVSGTTKTGLVGLQGGGINDCSSTLTLRNTTVNNNTGVAVGPPGGTAQGGGIWNADCGGGAPVLTLINSDVTHNRLTGSSGITIQGGGIYTTVPVTLTNSVITHNQPDNCYPPNAIPGCAG